MSLFDSDEEGFDSRGKKSHLDNLFNEAPAKGDFSHKRTKKSESSREPSAAATADSASLLTFYAVPKPGIELYQYDSSAKDFTHRGNVGCAVLFDKSSAKFSLYIYAKSQALVNMVVSSKFQYTVQENSGTSYGSFQDENKQRWSIQFPSKEAGEAFACHVAVAAFFAGPRNDIHSQELKDGQQEAVGDGDTVGTRWTGFIVDLSAIKLVEFGNNKTAQNPQRYTLGAANAVEGWERGTAGMKKGGRRIVVCPVSLLQGQDKGLVPVITAPSGYSANAIKDSPALFVIELERIKRGSAPATGPAKRDTPLPNIEDSPSSPPSSSSPSARERSTSSNGDDGSKEHLIKRMATLGKQVVPGGVSMEDADDEGRSYRNQAHSYHQHQHQHQHQHHHQHQHQHMYNNNPYTAYPGSMSGGMMGPGSSSAGWGQPGNQLALVSPASMTHPYMHAPPTPVPTPATVFTASPYGGLAPAPLATPPTTTLAPAPSSAPPGMPTQETIQLMVDERQYKTQIDGKLNTLLAKVDQLSDRVSTVAKATVPQDAVLSSGISGKALLATIQRIVADNDRMHSDVEEKTAQVTKLRDQVNDQIQRNQKLIDENNKYVEDRNRTFVDASSAQKKRLDELLDEKENLQIELADFSTKLNAEKRKFEDLKKKFQHVSEEVTSMQQDLERERALRETSSAEKDTAIAELNNFKQKYREENRKMTEAVQLAAQVQRDLDQARDQIEKLTATLNEKTQSHSTELLKIDTERASERDILSQQIEGLKAELRTVRTDAAKRLQEQEEHAQQQLTSTQEQLKARVQKEIDRRVASEIEKAVAEAQVKATEELQRTLTDARRQFAKEKERLHKLNEDDFAARLNHETKAAFEKGRAAGFKEGTQAASKTVSAEVTALQSQHKALATLSTSSSSHVLKQLRKKDAQLQSTKLKLQQQRELSYQQMTSTVKGIVNETFKVLRTQFQPEADYNGQTVLDTVKGTLIANTMGALPPPPEALPMEEEADIDVDVEEEDNLEQPQVEPSTEVRSEPHSEGPTSTDQVSGFSSEAHSDAPAESTAEVPRSQPDHEEQPQTTHTHSDSPLEVQNETHEKQPTSEPSEHHSHAGSETQPEVQVTDSHAAEPQPTEHATSAEVPHVEESAREQAVSHSASSHDGTTTEAETPAPTQPEHQQQEQQHQEEAQPQHETQSSDPLSDGTATASTTVEEVHTVLKEADNKPTEHDWDDDTHETKATAEPTSDADLPIPSLPPLPSDFAANTKDPLSSLWAADDPLSSDLDFGSTTSKKEKPSSTPVPEAQETPKPEKDTKKDAGFTFGSGASADDLFSMKDDGDDLFS